jgi:quercetin dioxygenase-like cupin family protein
MSVRLVLLWALLCIGLVPMLSAQDAVKADPQHYKVMSENDQVRVLKVHYGAHEKSVMHSHPNLVAVFLNDAKTKFTFPDGKTQTMDVKAGDAVYEPAVTHLPENVGENGMDIILVELKGK